MEAQVLYTIVQPKEEGKTPKIYYVEGNHFTSDKSEAHIFTDRDEVLAVQDRFDFDLQLEKAEE
ncbi:MAG: hypothetical protein IKP66_09825 [Lachnospiraceae bacterium]|nr:hypothetical protein [Lachnospiraceae bacterium]